MHLCDVNSQAAATGNPAAAAAEGWRASYVDLQRSGQHMPPETNPQPINMSYTESEGEHMPAAAAHDTLTMPASGQTASVVDGSNPTELGRWPALHLLGSSCQQFGSEPEQLLPSQLQQQWLAPAAMLADERTRTTPGPEPSPSGTAPPAASPPVPEPAPVRPSGNENTQQRSHPGHASPPSPQAPRSQHNTDVTDHWQGGVNDVDDLIMEDQELIQDQQQQHQQQKQQKPTQPSAQQPTFVPQAAGPPASPVAVGNGVDDWEDDFDLLLQEQQEYLAQQPPPPPPHYRPELEPELSSASPPSPQGQAAAGGVANLDAELDELDDQNQQGLDEELAAGSSRKRQRTQAGIPAAAAAAAGRGVGVGVGGGCGAGVDLGDELDQLFEEQEDAGDDDAVPEAAAGTALKPATLASLGAGTAGRSAAEALAALTAAAVPPRQLASSMTGCCLTVTGSSGQRVYCQLAAVRPSHEGAAGGARVCPSAAGLLAEPIDTLLNRLAERRRLEVLCEYEAAQALAQEVDELINQQDTPEDPAAPATAAAAAEVPDTGTAATQKQLNQEQQHDAAAAPRQLWVDKYAPKSFLQLLSEPRTNREIATWMSKWKKQPQHQQQHAAQRQQAGTQGLSGPDRQQQQQQQGRAFGRGAGAGGRGGGARGAAGNVVKGFDVTRYQAAQAARAAAKMLLIVGPPGTGKTTLAHVLAGHCGFRVVEINASDERTASSLTRRITDAAQMTHVLEGTKHPPCIVLDELDGAAGGAEGQSAITAVVKLVTGGAAGGRQHRRGLKPGAKSKSNRCPGLGVPVIATANDAYAPCLRPLREVAAIYHFKPPGPDRLMSRLAVITAAERLAMDRQALSALVDRSGCDIRTAINTLQLLARQASEPKATSRRSAVLLSSQHHAGCVVISAGAVWSSGALGLKDVSRTPLAVLQELLTAGANKAMTARLHQLAAATVATGQRSASNSSSKATAIAGAAAAARLQLQEQYNMLLDLGEHELVMSGVHEHLPDVVGLDVDLATTAAATAALSDADRLLAGGVVSGRGMVQYVPACVLSASKIAKREGGGLSSSTLTWPRAQAECSRVAASTRALIRSWRATAPASAAAALGTCTAAVMDFAPAFSAISRPVGIKAVSRQLLSKQQAALLDHVVAVLVSYGLTYSFPAEDAEHQLAPGYAAAPGQQLPRPAPLSPAVDTLHVYSALMGHSGCSSWRVKMMPLVLRQMMAQIISAENILRLDKARHGSELTATRHTHRKTPCKAIHTMQRQQQQKGPARVLDHKAAAKAAMLPSGKGKPAGTWLDALKARTAPKRRATGGAAERAAAKRQAVEPDPAAVPGAGAQQDGSQPGTAGYTVLYKFNEGYTNAVKRPMKVLEWLQ